MPINNRNIIRDAFTAALLITTALPAWASESIRLYDGGWENIQVNSAIAEFLIETVFDQPVEIVPSNVPGMQEKMISGEIDVNMEMWRSLMDPWVTKQLQSGVIVDLGITYESASQGFYVPSYVIQGDVTRGIEPIAPELKTVAQLANFTEQFSVRGAKPGWINCIPGWACREPNRVKMLAYGVGNLFEPIEVTSEAKLNEIIFRSYELGEPFVTYYWDPSPLLGQLDMTLLQEPAYSQGCWGKIEEAVADYEPGNVSEDACAYETVPISKFGTDEFVSEHPEIAATLSSMMVGTETIRDLVSFMTSQEVSPEKAAKHFYQNYPQIWTTWLDAEQVLRIQSVLHDSR